MPPTTDPAVEPTARLPRHRALCDEHTFAIVSRVHYEVDVTISKALDERTRQFLDAAQRSVNRVLRFTGDARSITLTVDVAGHSRDDAVRAAAGEVARIFPASADERYSEPRPV